MVCLVISGFMQIFFAFFYPCSNIKVIASSLLHIKTLLNIEKNPILIKKCSYWNSFYYPLLIMLVIKILIILCCSLSDNLEKQVKVYFFSEKSLKGPCSSRVKGKFVACKFIYQINSSYWVSLFPLFILKSNDQILILTMNNLSAINLLTGNLPFMKWIL